MGADIVKRPYITLGMLALLSLTPLAATSTTGMIRRLGARAWTRLHRLAYVAGVCAVLHYLWLAKVGVRDPYWYAGVLVALLGVRVWDWRRRVVRRRRRDAATAVSVNGRRYRAPDRPVVVVCIDGSELEYFERGLAERATPALARFRRAG